MPKLNFFPFISYQTPQKSAASFLLDKVHNYFYLGGKKAHVIQGGTKSGHEEVILSDTKSSVLARVGKVLSYFTVIIRLVKLIAKTALRSRRSFKIIDPKQATFIRSSKGDGLMSWASEASDSADRSSFDEIVKIAPKQQLEKGMNISEVTVAKIQQLIPKIINKEDDEAIEWLAKDNNLVFRIKETPNIVYKMAPPLASVYRGGKFLNSEAISDERFANMVKAKEVCLANDLGLLTIPHTKKFDVEVSGISYRLIAEESLDFNPNESANEELYHKYSTELNETARQLAIFVAKTGFNDVTWRNIPIINESAEFRGHRRVALIDLEHMESAKNGFLGDFNGSCGLIRCVSEKQIDNVIAEARKQGVAISENEAQKAKDRRLKELADDKQLRTFYTKNGVITGKEPIKVDLDSLGLDLTEEGQINVIIGVEKGKTKRQKQTVTLRKVTEDVIAEMNKLIQNSSEQESTKAKRYFVLDTIDDPFRTYNSLGLSSSKGAITEEENKQLWLRRIIQALVDKGHVFKLDRVNGYGYFIQA